MLSMLDSRKTCSVINVRQKDAKLCSKYQTTGKHVLY